jgi:hypothetical protein
MRLYRSPSPVLVLLGLLLAAPVAAQDSAPVKAGAKSGDPWASRTSAPAQTGGAKPAAPAAPSAAAQSATSSDTWAGGSAGGAKTPAVKRDQAAPRKQAVAKPRGKDKAKRKRTAGGPIAMSPGFAMLQGGKSRIFVEVSQKVDVTEQKAQGRIVYRIKGASVPLRNNRLPLLTGFFPTPVMDVRLVEQDNDVDLVIHLRQASTVEHRIVASEGGMVVQVDFPAVKSFVPPPIPNVATNDPARGKRMTETRKLESSGEPRD